MNHDVVSKLVRTGFILGLVASTPARAATAEEEAPPLRLQSMGVFYVGGRSGQGHLPVAGLSSSIYLGTPDGREGWAQYFARRGHPLYAVDLPDRSSASFPIDAINGCTHGDEGYPCSEVALGKTSLEQPWSVWGFGPVFGQQFDDSRFPALPLQERYVEQFAAGFEISAGSGAGPQGGGDGGRIGLTERARSVH